MSLREDLISDIDGDNNPPSDLAENDTVNIADSVRINNILVKNSNGVNSSLNNYGSGGAMTFGGVAKKQSGSRASKKLMQSKKDNK
jgi:hypothetical protein